MSDAAQQISTPNRALQSVVLGVGFALLVAVVLGCAWLLQQQAEDAADVRRVLELQNRYSRALSLLQDAETGQRGFLLTEDENYLKPFQGTAIAFAQEMAEIEKLIVRKDRLPELRGIRDLAAAKFAEIDSTIAKMLANDKSGAVEIVKTNRGKLIMDEVRVMMARMLAFDDRILKESLSEANENARLLQWGILAAILFVTLLAFYVIVTHRRHVRALISAITQRERAESQVRQMQKMQAIGQLTGGIAHDFNNMLAIIIGSLSLLQKRLARGDTDVARYSEAAMEGAQRAATLTSRLLAFSRQQPLMPVTLDLNKTVAGMSELLRRTLGENIHMETVLAGGLWRAHSDPSELENAILNLCVNARDAMPEGGRLTIETANSYLDEAYAADHMEVPAGQYVQIAISDTGTGMSKDVAARAFDPFFTTKPVGKGTGLGAIAGLRLREAKRRSRENLFGVAGYDRENLPAPHPPRRGRGTAAEAAASAGQLRRDYSRGGGRRSGSHHQRVGSARTRLHRCACRVRGYGARKTENASRRQPAVHRHRYAGHERPRAGDPSAQGFSKPESAVHDRLHA
jgi:signal transduction histidine kinase